jgi:hypothetical protein
MVAILKFLRYFCSANNLLASLTASSKVATFFAVECDVATELFDPTFAD